MRKIKLSEGLSMKLSDGELKNLERLRRIFAVKSTTNYSADSSRSTVPNQDKLLDAMIQLSQITKIVPDNVDPQFYNLVVSNYCGVSLTGFENLEKYLADRYAPNKKHGAKLAALAIGQLLLIGFPVLDKDCANYLGISRPNFTQNYGPIVRNMIGHMSEWLIFANEIKIK